ncbi:hypothetical protein [Alkalihalobacillus sp. BA299]|nr:hypothetical protein [Alkalihalobacillus sp. BA299]
MTVSFISVNIDSLTFIVFPLSSAVQSSPYVGKRAIRFSYDKRSE